MFEGPPGDSDAAAGATPVRRRRRPLILAGVAAAALLGTGFAVRAARQRAQAAARRPAVVALAIEPWGEVVIDGVSRGRTPPLARIEVPPGKHTIEVRHPPQQPVALKVDLDPGEELALRHTFAAAAPPPAVRRQPPQKPPQEQPSKVRRMWNDFRKQAGF